MNDESNLADAVDAIEAAQEEYSKLNDAIKKSAPFTATDKDGNEVQLDDNKKLSGKPSYEDRDGNKYRLMNNKGQVTTKKSNL